MPTIRKDTSATTLISANQNSSSPNTLTLMRLRPRTRIRAARAQAHCGTSAIGAQYFLKKFMYSATAVMSTIAVMAQFSQYSQPVTNAAFSPKNSRA